MNNSFRAKPIGDADLSPIGFAASQNQRINNSDSGATHEKFVVFFLGEQLFAVSTQKIAEVTPPLAIAALPHAPQWLLGIANLRGEMITVLNLAKIIGSKFQTSRDKTKFVVLNTKKFDTPIAFPVDRLNEITTFGNQTAFVSDENSPLISSKFSYQNKEVCLVDTEQIFRLIASA